MQVSLIQNRVAIPDSLLVSVPTLKITGGGTPYRGFVLLAQFFYYAFCHKFIDFFMTRYWLTHFAFRILIPVMISAMTDKQASFSVELF